MIISCHFCLIGKVLVGGYRICGSAVLLPAGKGIRHHPGARDGVPGRWHGRYEVHYMRSTSSNF